MDALACQFRTKERVCGAEAPRALKTPPQGGGLQRLFVLILAACAVVHGQEALPPMLEGVGVEEKIGRNINLDLTFIGEDGYPVALRQFFQKGRPIILNLVYYNCPMLCNLVLNGQTAALRDIPWTPGDEFEVVTISIDPSEGFDLARQKKGLYLGTYDRPAPGWHFLVDHENHAKRLAESIGFHYRYDGKIEQYAHAAAIMVLSPEGKMSRYLYGIRYKARDLRLALTEASEGKGKFTIEKLLLFCYHYDPESRSYTLFARNIMRAGGTVTVLVLGLVLLGFWRRERRRTAIEETLVPVR
jgi:protein SCO1/2